MAARDNIYCEKPAFGLGGEIQATAVEDIAKLVAGIIGVNADGFSERVLNGDTLTVEDLTALGGRAPSSLRPIEAAIEQRETVLAALQAGLPAYQHAIKAVQYKFKSLKSFTAEELYVWCKSFTKESKKLTSYMRVRLEKLLWLVIQSDMLNSEVEQMLWVGAKLGWERGRATTFIGYMILASDAGKAEMMQFLTLGGAGLGTLEVRAAGKLHHQLVRSFRYNLEMEYLPCPRCVMMLCYLDSCCGRSEYLSPDQLAQEIEVRGGEVPDYQDPDPDAEQPTTALIRKFFKDVVASCSESAGHRTWSEFIPLLGIKLEGNSTSVSRPKLLADVEASEKRSLLESREGALLGKECAVLSAVAGSGNMKLQGTKRLAAEIYTYTSLDAAIFLNLTFIIVAFLKYETSKNRFIYPTSFHANLLCLFIVDSYYRDVLRLPGINIGEDLAETIATHLDVIDQCDLNLAGGALDAEAFNEGHSFDIQASVLQGGYDALAGKRPSGDADVSKALDIYNRAKRQAKVHIYDPFANRHVEVDAKGTLFSGELLTMLMNTIIMLWLLTVTLKYCIKCNETIWMKYFVKGDDMNVFAEHWIVITYFSLVFERTGASLGAIKDLIEIGSIEDQRCLVTGADGYRGSLMRRWSAIHTSEPQGSAVLTISQNLVNASEARNDLIARGADPEGANIIFMSLVNTYLNVMNFPEEVNTGCGAPPCIGGLGLWDGSDFAQYDITARNSPTIPTAKLVLGDDSIFNEPGSATMTDGLLEHVVEVHGEKYREAIFGCRNDIIGDAIRPSYGVAVYGKKDTERWSKGAEEPSAKVTRLEEGEIYKSSQGERGAEEKEPVQMEVHKYVDGYSGHDNLARYESDTLTRFRKMRDGKRVRAAKGLSVETKNMVLVWASELDALLSERDHIQLRIYDFSTPETIVIGEISKRVLLNLQVAKAILGCNGLELYKSVVSNADAGMRSEIVAAVNAMSDKMALAMYAGKIKCIFWGKNEGVTSKARAIVQAFVIQKAALNMDGMHGVGTRTVNEVVEANHLVSEAGKIVWKVCKKHLGKMCY